MTSSSHLSDNLALLEHETDLLLSTAAALDDDTIRVASLCEGWTRAHVLSHIARNADALGNLVSWAVTGIPRAMYDSPDSRDGDIAAGATHGAQELFTDVKESAQRFATAARGLAGPPEQAEVEMRGGRVVRGEQLPTLRLLEVVFHHVDLKAGYTFANTDPGLVRRAISIAVQRLTARDRQLSMTLSGDEGETWSLGGGTEKVAGTNSSLLLWLARGHADGVSSDSSLPDLPSWG